MKTPSPFFYAYTFFDLLCKLPRNSTGGFLGWFQNLGELFVYTCMPLVTAYHLLTGNLFLNTSFTEAEGVEKWGNWALSPLQYLCAGELVSYDGSQYIFELHFDYQHHLLLKTAGSLIGLPFALTLGPLLKGMAYLDPDVQNRHKAILQSRKTCPPIPSSDFYSQWGIPETHTAYEEKMPSRGYPRNPEDFRYLSEEKKVLKKIIDLFEANGLIFWADCGTCLGVYRYGGAIPWDMDIDLAILQPDFDRAIKILQALPPEDCRVLDWSSRLHPKTLIRIYVQKTREFIDIYHFAINAERQTIQSILSHKDNMFLPQFWKTRESRFTVETPFSVVFPLKMGEFDGIEIPVPQQTEYYLQQRYGEGLSPVKVYDEKSRTYVKDPSHPYWQRTYAH